MKEDIKVSIIIPVYGVEKYISQCLESVINQSYENIEIIVVNDGTKDNSMKIVEEYLLDERIKIINKENGGLASARNRGIEEATGEYIYFLDSDDWIEVNTIEVLVEESNNLDIIYSNFWYFDEKNKKKRKNKEKIKSNMSMTGEYLLGYSTEIMVWNKIYKKSFLEEKQLRFLEGIIHEDEEFTFKCYMNSPQVKYIDIYTYNYRINRENSIMNDIKNKEKIEYSIKSFEMIVENLKKSLKDDFSEFIKLRFFLRERNLKNFISKKRERSISKEEIINFEKELNNFDMKNFNKLEKNIIKNEIRNILLQKNFPIFRKIYWRNRIINMKFLRKVISRRIRGI